VHILSPTQSRENDGYGSKHRSKLTGSIIKNGIFETLQMMQDNNLIDDYGSETGTP